MERSALLSHPPSSSDSAPDGCEEVSAGQSSPPASPGTAGPGEVESSSQSEQESTARPEQRPAVEG